MSKQISLGNVLIGGDAKISVQSMLNCDTCDIDRVLREIEELKLANCDIIRLAVLNMDAAKAFKDIVKNSPIPVIADIHFDYELALEVLKHNVAGIRLNPGNLKNQDEIRQIALMAKEKNCVIRVGSNSGSVDVKLLAKLQEQYNDHDQVMTEALVLSALEQCKLLENFGFDNIKVSLKSSSVPITVKAYRKFAEISEYPLHIGVTEAGTMKRGIIKSAVGIGALLLDNIGNTMRVSLSSSPIEEVKVARQILASCNLLDNGVDIISCPTCGRTQIELIKLANEIEDFIDQIEASGKKINLKKIAVMGCIVNGPGEARDADLGLAGGKGKIAIFQHGKIIGSFTEAEGLAHFKELIKTAVSPTA